MRSLGIALTLLAAPIGAMAQEGAPASPAPNAVAPGLIPGGTPVELMVIKEVSSRTAKVGDKVKLRVNAPVLVGGQQVVPVGATAWGEVTSVSGTGAAGQGGRLALRLLNLETSSGPVELAGSSGAQGDGNTAGVLLGVLAWGPLGLLNKGDNALFKAGDIVKGYVGPIPTQPVPTAP